MNFRIITFFICCSSWKRHKINFLMCANPSGVSKDGVFLAHADMWTSTALKLNSCPEIDDVSTKNIVISFDNWFMKASTRRKKCRTLHNSIRFNQSLMQFINTQLVRIYIGSSNRDQKSFAHIKSIHISIAQSKKTSGKTMNKCNQSVGCELFANMMPILWYSSNVNESPRQHILVLV